jgi:hypothetical protein
MPSHNPAPAIRTRPNAHETNNANRAGDL